MAMRFCTLAFVVATALGAVAGCQGNGGAVSVRWRIANLSTGRTWDPMSFGANDGSCCSDVDSAHNCEATSIWVVRSVVVTLRDPSTDVPVPNVMPVRFPCDKREATTAFDLPPGTYAIGLGADVFDGMNNPAPSVVPPPEVHTIIRGDIVNLQNIQVGVQPLPTGNRVPLPHGEGVVTF
jgi:hypothetical protein